MPQRRAHAAAKTQLSQKQVNKHEAGTQASRPGGLPGLSRSRGRRSGCLKVLPTDPGVTHPSWHQDRMNPGGKQSRTHTLHVRAARGGERAGAPEHPPRWAFLPQPSLRIHWDTLIFPEYRRYRTISDALGQAPSPDPTPWTSGRGGHPPSMSNPNCSASVSGLSLVLRLSGWGFCLLLGETTGYLGLLQRCTGPGAGELPGGCRDPCHPAKASIPASWPTNSARFFGDRLSDMGVLGVFFTFPEGTDTHSYSFQLQGSGSAGHRWRP